MTVRVCIGPNTETRCPTAELTRKARCPDCAKRYEQARGSSTARGYGSKHRALRAQYQRRMDSGETFTCWRCTKPIDLTDWTLGHCDDDRTKYHGPECPPCDYATSGRTSCPHPMHNYAARTQGTGPRVP